MEKQEKKLFLLDAYALIYRAFFALNKNPRINSKGVNTSAVMGFLNSLYEILQKEKPTHIGVAFDVAGTAQRQAEYSEYKANREKMPDDLREAIPYIIRLIEAFNIAIYGVEGYEADDVIGTMSKKAEQQGFLTYMMTPDKDFGQLVTDRVLLYKPAKFGEPAQVWGPKEVCERYGIQEPKQLIDILGLWGDAADNIPGIPGIGEKTAAALVGKYGSVENLIAHADELKGKQKENVINFAEQGLMSKALATINLEVPVEFDEEELKAKEPDVPALMALFEELEFKTFAKRFLEDYKTKQSALDGPSTLRGTSGIAGSGTSQSLRGTKQSMEMTEGSQQPNLFSSNETFDLFHQGDNRGILEFSDKDSARTVSHDYKLVESDADIKALTDLLSKQTQFVFDTETTNIDVYSAELVGLSFAIKAHEAWYLPMPADRDECQKRLELLRPLFEDESIMKIGQNLKYDISMLAQYGIKVKGRLFDTMLAHYLLEPEQRHNMDYLAEAYLDYITIPIEDLIGKGRQQRSMREVPVEQVKEYAAEDADITLQLYEKLSPMLKENGVEKLLNDIEMPLVPVLSRMEANGVKIDTENLKQISDEFGRQIQQVEEKIYEAAGMPFNIASPKQLGEVLFEKLRIDEKAKKTKTGQYATGEDVLQKLSHKHPIIQMILDYRSFTKLKSTYLDALPALVNPKDGLIHTSYNQAVTATGRLSSNNPNLQNIPVRTAQGREIRKAFVPRSEHYTLLAADYSQIELRIIAHLSQDPAMVADFNLGHDIHAATAAKVFHVPMDQVTKEQRSRAKAVNFGIIYGMSAFGLAERMELSRSEAADIIKKYFEEYAGIKEYMNRSIALARERGYAETILGRRRYLRDINGSNSVVRGFAERNAINAPIQGSSADMIKIAMIGIHQELEKLKMQSKMILQVHDELVFDAHLDELDTLKAIVNDKMVNALPLSVPVIVEMNTGANWLEAH
ncbi:MAG: DNA polymerase I [Bacteroidales bacterium]|nr:DNA polymerase I [Bacteroidales bacterium]